MDLGVAYFQTKPYNNHVKINLVIWLGVPFNGGPLGTHFVWRIAMLDKEKNIRHTTNSQVKRTVFPPTYFTYMYIYICTIIS